MSSGTRIPPKTLQQMLIRAGFGETLGPMRDDGIIGSRTIRALRQFQQAQNITGDPFRPETLARLEQVTRREEQVAPSLIVPVVARPGIMLSPARPATREFGDDQRAHLMQRVAQEVGRGESGGDNAGPDLVRYRQPGVRDRGAWCGDFFSAMANAAHPGLITHTRVVSGIMAQYRQFGALHSAGSEYQPRAGDAIFFMRGDTASDRRWMRHAGFVERVDPDGTVHTIEGNRADPNQPVTARWSADNPDQVRRVSYTPQQLREHAHLGFGNTGALARARGIGVQRAPIISVEAVPNDGQPLPVPPTPSSTQAQAHSSRGDGLMA